MKSISLIIFFSILLGGCARKSELEKTRADLIEAQQKIEILENERIPRTQYDIARASLKIADRQITDLERELKSTQQQLAVLEKTRQSVETTSDLKTKGSESPTTLALEAGAYESTNETYVYSADAQLNFGRHLQIFSPTGLMVSDPEQKVVGGDLNIRAKDVLLETSDGLLTTSADGSVKFTGKTLTMKFEDKKPAQDVATETPLSPEAALPAPAGTPSTSSP